MLSLFLTPNSRSLNKEKRASRCLFWKFYTRWRIPLTVRLALGFFLAALFAAAAAWLLGSQHAETLRKQSDFYQALLQTNTNLTNGTELLKSIHNQSAKLLNDTTTDHPNANELATDEQGLRTLMTRYDQILLSYASHDSLSQNPDQITLLEGNNPQTQIEQQRIYIDSALHTWEVCSSIRNNIINDINSGNIAQAQNVARLQGERAYADSLSALQSLIQFNEQLSTLVDQGANYETKQQLMNTLLGSFFTFLGILLMGIVISYPLVRRLRRLHHITQAVEAGKTDARVPIIGNDEITDVSNSVNTMLDALVESIKHTTAAKEQLDRAYQQQYQLNQMKDQFIRNVSHELRTPLTEIYGFLQLLDEHQGEVDASTQALFVKQAIHGCEDLLSLFTTILDAAHISTIASSPKLEKVSLYPILKSIIEQSDPRERETHPISLEVPESLTACADPQYLRQVLRNLLSNAFKYTPAETPIFIQIGDAKGTSLEYTHVCLCVKDTGPGIPPEEQGTLFQQFARLKRDQSGTIRGTGLGLYICRQFVEAMNGKIWLESSGIAGEGTSFCFTLPA